MKLVVLMGGVTAEREISLSTGTGIAAALRRIGHEVVSIDAANGGVLESGSETESALETVDPSGSEDSSALLRVPAISESQVIFIALHGGSGEDGTLQAVLDLTGRPYTGSGHLACGLAMDKAMSKRLFEHAGIPTPRWMLLARETGPPDPADLEPLGAYPLVIKPNDQGSTVGLTIINHASEIPAAFREAARHSRGILVETYIPGREMTVSMLGDRPLPVVEIIPNQGLYDYRAKYTAGMSTYQVPAQVPAELAERMQEYGQRAYRLLGCDGVARVDFRLDPENRLYCLELNTVPGMTPTSLVPMAAKAIGVEYDELVAQMVQMAIDRRAAERGQTTTTS